MTSPRLRFSLALVAVAAIVAGPAFRPARAQANVTPGMLFGPLRVEHGQRIELCSSYLSEGLLIAAVHFRNSTTGEVTAPVKLTILSGGGACATYYGRGNVVGMTRALEGSSPTAGEWLSPSNALIGTMSVIDNGRGTRVSVPGIAKLWLTGL